MADTNVITREKLLAEWQRWCAARLTEDKAAQDESMSRFDALFDGSDRPKPLYR